MAGLFETPDDRTDEEYEQEVDMYCQKYKAALLRRYRWRLRKHLGTRLCIEAVNPTEDNFTGIELEIHVPGRVQKWPDDAGTNDVDEPELPARPLVLGSPKPKIPNSWPGSALMAPPRMPSELGRFAGPSYTVKNTGSVTVSLTGIDLRPKQRLRLPSVPLLVDESEGAVLDCQWTATASNVSGHRTGAFALTVGPTTLRLNLTA